MKRSARSVRTIKQPFLTGYTRIPSLGVVASLVKDFEMHGSLAEGQHKASHADTTAIHRRKQNSIGTPSPTSSFTQQHGSMTESVTSVCKPVLLRNALVVGNPTSCLSHPLLTPRNPNQSTSNHTSLHKQTRTTHSPPSLPILVLTITSKVIKSTMVFYVNGVAGDPIDMGVIQWMDHYNPNWRQTPKVRDPDKLVVLSKYATGTRHNFEFRVSILDSDMTVAEARI